MTDDAYRAELLRQKDLLESVFDATPDIMMILGDNCRVEKVNHAGRGFVVSDSVGLLCGSAIRCRGSYDPAGCGKAEACPSCTLRTLAERTMRDGTSFRECEGEIACMIDGREQKLTVLVSTARLRHAHENRALMCISDITERNLLSRELELGNEILVMVAEGRELPETLAALCRYTESLDEGIRASVLLYDPDRKVLLPGAAPSLPADYNALMEAGLPIGLDVGSCGTAAFTRKPAVAADIQNDPKWTPYGAFIEKTREHDLKACWSLPIFSSTGAVLGAFANYRNRIGDPSQLNLRVLGWAVRIAGMAIEKKQGEEKLRQFSEQMKIRNMELDFALASAEAANRAKSEFLANMSHELRTPFNGIMGVLQLLKTTNLNEKQSLFVSQALNASNRFTQLLTDLLVIAQAESGTSTLSAESFGIEGLCAAVVDLFAIPAAEKRIALDCRLDPLLPPELIGDPGRVRQVLFNLLGNALKFTETGSIGLELTRLTPGRGEHIRVLFTITDTGVGIPEDKLRTLFAPFVQVDGSYTRKYQGAGLGLAVVRRLVDQMGGNISVETTEGRGTSVHVVLSFTLPDAPAMPVGG